jgi:hypothetical protein
VLTSKLVRLIEKHAEGLTREIVRELRTDPYTTSYRQVLWEQDRVRVFDVVSHLGHWLDTESDSATEEAHRKPGQQRFAEAIPLAEVVYALALTKRVLRHYGLTHGWVDSAVELYQLTELYDMISHSFDRATYFTVLAYEEARSSGDVNAALHLTKAASY